MEISLNEAVVVDGWVRRKVIICNQKGLHARAAAKFVKTVANFDADVEVSRSGTTVGGSSIMGLMMLAAAPGCSLDIAASGTDAESVVEALADLVCRKFDED